MERWLWYPPTSSRLRVDDGGGATPPISVFLPFSPFYLLSRSLSLPFMHFRTGWESAPAPDGATSRLVKSGRSGDDHPPFPTLWSPSRAPIPPNQKKMGRVVVTPSPQLSSSLSLSLSRSCVLCEDRNGRESFSANSAALPPSGKRERGGGTPL